MFVEYQLTTDDWLAYHSAKANRSTFLTDSMRRQRWRSLQVWLLYTVLLGFATRSWIGFAVGALLSAIMVAKFPHTFYENHRNNIARLMTPERNPCLNGLHRFETLPTGVRITCDMTDVWMPWKRIEGVDTTEHHVFIRMNGECGYVLPRDRIVSGDLDAVIDSLRRGSAEPA